MISEKEAKEILLNKLNDLFTRGQQEGLEWLRELRANGEDVDLESAENEEPFNVWEGLTVTTAIATDQAWVFMYQDSRYLETKDINYALDGNYPILISKNGDAYQLGDERTVKEYMELYETGQLREGPQVRKL